MDKLSNFVDIRLANLEDVGSIMKHYQQNWSQNHIIANDVQYLLYEHLDDGRLNFVIGLDENSKNILAAIGFSDYGRYGAHRHITSTMLSVSDQCKIPLLGIEMIRALKYLTNSSSYSGVTTNPVTIAPYVKRFLKHKVGFFDHLYIANSNISEYKILLGTGSARPSSVPLNQITLIEIFCFDAILALTCVGVKQKNIPYKSLSYINRRYFSHPIFKYRYFVCQRLLDGLDALLIVKIESIEDRTALRIIDFIGPLDMLNNLSYSLSDLIGSEGHEYCDLFCSNASAFLSNSHCFLDRRLSNIIIPHYFYPFCRENIDVLYETDNPDYVYFKGDGDGDRPNYRALSDNTVTVKN